METKPIELDLEKPTIETATKIFNEVLTPIMKQVIDECGSDQCCELFFDIVYVLTSAQVQVNGYSGAESIVNVVNNVIADNNLNAKQDDAVGLGFHEEHAEVKFS